MMEIWFRQSAPRITFRDPLAAAVIFDHSLCSCQPGTISDNVDDAPGQACWQAGDGTSPHLAAFEADAAGYFKHFFGVLNSL